MVCFNQNWCLKQHFLGQKYKLEKSHNFDNYMKELGVGLTLRKMGNTVTSTCKLSQEKDGSFLFVLESPYRSSSITFESGIPFQEITLDNRVVRTVCTLEENVFKQTQSAHGVKTTEIVRVYENDKLTTILTAGNVKAVRIYRVLKE